MFEKVFRDVMRRPMRLSQRLIDKHEFLFGFDGSSSGVAIMQGEQTACWGLIRRKGIDLAFYTLGEDKTWDWDHSLFVTDYAAALIEHPELDRFRFYESMDAPYPDFDFVKCDKIMSDAYDHEKTTKAEWLIAELKERGVRVKVSSDDEERHVVEVFDATIGRGYTAIDQDLCEAVETAMVALGIEEDV